jgi:uncharacterized protein with GYD domain
MATYVTLVNFTDQGIRNVKDSPARYEAFKAAAESLGVAVKSALWTQGAYDLVLVTDGPEDAQMALSLKTASLGNVRTQTLRGYTLTVSRGLLAAAGLG